jgi:eukaryotic-like serine/threonine-protein kinase
MMTWPPQLRAGLLGRVALALAAVGLLPLAILSAGLVGLNRDAMTEQVQRTHAVAAQTAAAQTGAFLAARLALARGLAGDPAVLDDPGGAAGRAALGASLAAWADLGVLAVARLDAGGAEVVRAQLKGGGPALAAALAAPAGEPVAAFAGGADPASAPLVRLDVPLAGGGALRLVCSGAELAELLRPVEIGEQAEMVLADRAGRRVAGTGDPASFPPALVAAARSGRASGAGRYRSSASSPGSDDSDDSAGSAGFDSAPVIGAFAPVPVAGWAVLSRQPAAVAEAVAGRLRTRSGLAIGAALALILALSAVSWRALVRPLRELAQSQRQLARIDTPPPAGDEIADLRQSLLTLERSLADRSAVAQVLLGRYQVIDVLGAGAMGTVFRGFDPRLKRPVALKTVRLGDGLAAERRQVLLASLLHEAVTLASLSHPNVVQVYDVAEAPEAAVVAMELVEGPSLERLLGGRIRLTAAEVVPLGAAIARGLDAAHRRGIVHRDVKPGNVLLGFDGAVKVNDFGIADLQAAAAAPVPGMVFGTPGYLAPECLMGEAITPASDLFSLGVVLYACLSGTQPFVGRTGEEVLQATLFGRVRPLARQVPDLPPDLEALVASLLERQPERRPAGAGAVAAALERLALAGGLTWSLRPADGLARGAGTAPLTMAAQPLSVIRRLPTR